MKIEVRDDKVIMKVKSRRLSNFFKKNNNFETIYDVIEVNLDIDSLYYAIGLAKIEEAKLFGIVVDIDGNQELIINEVKNMNEKYEYYKRIYTKDLVMKKNKKIRIVDYGFGDSLEELDYLYIKEEDIEEFYDR